MSKLIFLGKVIFILACLYFFICSLDILSTSFKLLAGEATGTIFNGKWLSNPVVALMIGILGTVLVQSSSTFTSIIVAAIGAGMSVHIAIPMIMGANIGTSVTNTLVAITQIGNRQEFERAFSAATVHDMFNWATVILLFTIECLIGANFLEKMTDGISESLAGRNTTGAKVKVLGYITDPLTDSIIDINKKVLKKWALNETCKDCRLIVTCSEGTNDESCNYLFYIPSLSDQSIGVILLVLSLIVLCTSLFLLVKTLNSLLHGPLAQAVKKFVNPQFKSPLTTYLFGYWNIIVGAIGTILVQSSSVFTSTLTPMVGIGLIEIENVYPLFLGSNIGTTCTAMLAALTQSGSETFKATLQGAFVHLFFNIIGILIFFPVPMMRIPIPLCRKLGKITAQYRWFALVYILFMFFLLPGIFVGLTLLDPSSITMYIFLALMALIISLIVCINYLQSSTTFKTYLPEKLQNWNFLPKALRSLAPYDRLLTKCSCFKKCMDSEEPEEQDEKDVAIGMDNFAYEKN